MNKNIISAVFDSRSEAEAAISELRSQESIAAGFRSSAGTGTARPSPTVRANRPKKAWAIRLRARGGAGIGAILGVAALAIPGVGPLAAAGAIASSAIPGAAAIGAGAGAVAGGLTGLLRDHGVSDDDASYYEGRINDGGIFVSVDASEGDVPTETVREVLSRNGGHSASQPRMASARNM